MFEWSRVDGGGEVHLERKTGKEKKERVGVREGEEGRIEGRERGRKGR